MAGLLKIIVDHHRRNRRRDENFDFFKACIAAAALIAISDGNACRMESTALRAMIKTLQDLQLYDPAHGMEIYEGFVGAMESDFDKGSGRAIQAIARVKDQPHWAALLVAISVTMSEADGVVLESEVESIERICQVLDIDAALVKSFDIDVSTELLD